MISLFLGLTLANLIALLTTIGLGYVASNPASNLRGWHTLAGAMSLMLCIGVHCVVFTYFMATAKWVQHAVTVKGLDPSFSTPTRSFKHQALPVALGAILIVFLTAIFGAAVDSGSTSVVGHHLLALAAFGANIGAATAEYAAIRRNGALIDQILSAKPAPDAESKPFSRVPLDRQT